MAMAKNPNALFDLEQALFRRRQQAATWQKVSRNGLRVTVGEGPSWAKDFAKEIARLLRFT